MKGGERADPANGPIKIMGFINCPLCDGKMALGTQNGHVLAKHKAPVCNGFKAMRTADFAKLLRETYGVDTKEEAINE